MKRCLGTGKSNNIIENYLCKTSFICSVKVFSGAIVCEECKLRGDITIGAGTIIHPSATIIAEAGPIIIGDYCLIEEQVKIIHRCVGDFTSLLALSNKWAKNIQNWE